MTTEDEEAKDNSVIGMNDDTSVDTMQDRHNARSKVRKDQNKEGNWTS